MQTSGTPFLPPLDPIGTDDSVCVPHSRLQPTSDSLSLVQLRDIALYQIRPALLRVHGVASVEVTGGDVREFGVTVSPSRLATYHLDATQVADAIQKTNLVKSTGLVYNNYKMYLALVSGLVHSVDDIKAIVVATHNGAPIRVADVADVEPTVADRIVRTTARGRDAVLINILKHPTGSTVQIGHDVNVEVAGLSLPRGVHFECFYDQGDFIGNSISGTRDSIAIGVILAMIVLFVFLRSWRMTLVIMLVVPATLATTLLCLNAVGLTINIMTLGGMAAAVGLIIDDAIVVIEYVFTRLARHEAAPGEQQVSLAASIGPSLRDLMPAILGSTASTIVIHIPLAFLGGITGAFFASLSATMVIAMLLSFILSLSLAPLLASRLLRKKDVEREVGRERKTSRFATWYERLMRRFMRYRVLAIPVVLLFLGLAYFLYGQIGNSFMPEMDEGTFVLDYVAPPGTSLDETNRILMNLESILNVSSRGAVVFSSDRHPARLFLDRAEHG